MAGPSSTDDRIEEVVEELTVQQVILSSLQGETWDNIDEERALIVDEIDRLKRLLKKLEQDRARARTEVKDGTLMCKHGARFSLLSFSARPSIAVA
jgi:hypothetical protein